MRLGESIDLQDGDVVTSHGTYADVNLTRADGTVVSLSIEPGGSIGSGPDPMVIRHRGGRVIAGSLAGFTADSSVFDSGPNAMAAAPSGVVRTTVTKGRVALALDPSGRALTVRSLAGKAVVQAGSATLALPAGAEALATSTKVRRLPPAPDLSRVVPAPRVLAAGPVQLVVPRRISSRSLSDARCLAVGLRSTGSAQVLVTLLAGTATRGSLITRSRLGVPSGARAEAVPAPLTEGEGYPGGHAPHRRPGRPRRRPSAAVDGAHPAGPRLSYGIRLIGRVTGGPVRGAGPPVPATALSATPTAIRRRVRASKVRARNGTGMQATRLPARRKTTTFWPKRRMLRMPLKILTFTRAGLVLTTSVRTHLEFFREPQGDLPRGDHRRRGPG